MIGSRFNIRHNFSKPLYGEFSPNRRRYVEQYLTLQKGMIGIHFLSINTKKTSRSPCVNQFLPIKKYKFVLISPKTFLGYYSSNEKKNSKKFSNMQMFEITL